MNSNEKVVNSKVVELIDINNFCFGHFFIRIYLNKVSLYVLHK
jgi:hypothetical protein